jgi:hypothetical protein
MELVSGDEAVLRALVEDLLSKQVFEHNFFKSRVGLVTGESGHLTVQL